MVLPHEIQNAIAMEQARGDTKLRQAQNDLLLLRREVEKEKVARTAGRKAMDEWRKEAENKFNEVTA